MKTIRCPLSKSTLVFLAILTCVITLSYYIAPQNKPPQIQPPIAPAPEYNSSKSTTLNDSSDLIEMLARKKEVVNDTNIIGIWKDDFNKDIIWRIRKDVGTFYILEMSDSGRLNWHKQTTLTEEVQQHEHNRNFLDNEDKEQYYILDSNGNLSPYDYYGYIATYPKIQN